MKGSSKVRAVFVADWAPLLLSAGILTPTTSKAAWCSGNALPTYLEPSKAKTWVLTVILGTTS